MRSGLMKLCHDIGDGVADTWNRRQRARRDDPGQGLGESSKAIGGTQVRLRAVRIAAAERCPLRIFPEKSGDRLTVILCHFKSNERMDAGFQHRSVARQAARRWKPDGFRQEQTRAGYFLINFAIVPAAA